MRSTNDMKIGVPRDYAVNGEVAYAKGQKTLADTSAFSTRLPWRVATQLHEYETLRARRSRPYAMVLRANNRFRAVNSPV